MTTRDIQDIVRDLYGVTVSHSLISEITADLDSEATAWRTQRRDRVYPIGYLDRIVVHVCGDKMARFSPHDVCGIGRELTGNEGAFGTLVR